MYKPTRIFLRGDQHLAAFYAKYLRGKLRLLEMQLESAGYVAGHKHVFQLLPGVSVTMQSVCGINNVVVQAIPQLPSEVVSVSSAEILYKIATKINGAEPTHNCYMRLYHPGTGYTGSYIHPNINFPATREYDYAEDQNLCAPGHYTIYPEWLTADITDCYVELSRYNAASRLAYIGAPVKKWLDYYFKPVTAEVSSIEEITGSADLYVVNLSTEATGDLPTPASAKHIWVYNIGARITLSGVVINNEEYAQFYWTGAAWSHPHLSAQVRASSVADIVGAAVLTQYNTFSITSAGHNYGTLESLAADITKDIWIYNNGPASIAITGFCVVDHGVTVHLHWDGFRWHHVAAVNVVTGGPQELGFEIYSTAHGDYFRTIEVTNGTEEWFAPVNWIRSTKTIGEMAVVNGERVAEFNAWEVTAFLNNIDVSWSSADVIAAVCACEQAWYDRGTTTVHGVGINSTIQAPGYNLKDVVYGNCSDTVGWRLGESYWKLGSHTASADSIALVTNAAGTITPVYTDWVYYADYVVAWAVFDLFPAGEKTYCDTSEVIDDLRFFEYSKGLIPTDKGYF